MKTSLFLFALLGLGGSLSLTSCQKEPESAVVGTGNPTNTGNTGGSQTGTQTGTPTIRVQTLLTNYEIIWGMDFLPNGDLLFTERKGRLFRYAGGTATELTGLPTDINISGQGGLLDLRVHPAYATNGWIYCSYSSSPAGSRATQLNLIRFKINANRITNLETIFKTSATNTWYGHYGARIEFDKNGLLYFSVGEGGPSSYGGASSPNQNAQNVKTEWGKIHRMTDSGQVPADNPTLPGNTTPTTIFSYGHRNPQGLALNPFTGDLWETEHGPKGGDEVNIIQSAKNYGWPLVSYGINYDGTPISTSPTRDGIQAPVHTWTPSIGTCGLAFITSDKFKDWKGNLVTGSLPLNYLSRCAISNNKVVSEAKLLENQGRIRNVKQGPDGSLYVSIEGPGRIVQLIPE
ncbi:PQQ-dependent sugar dehydrogenase [Spirosoma taeanense]|uniref:PQQ-dependent sugar dehydrogenase n=1 Tax=Spirosoma taeanense TaxID=2735870 RepID=A0A6M5YCA2_9BACT|nr:PQQ-dependent sugar dehydrogenase [Spirosoma taeanense]QJW90871.1 PQQ-dependent sugar dehydrogenase [Spirosoma taeanense]